MTYIQTCPHCGSDATEYRGTYSAPGYGQAWKCHACGEHFAVYGKTAETEPRIFDPEDVR